MNMSQALSQTQQTGTLTDNGAFALNTTGSAVLDFYGVAGAIRNRTPQQISDLFLKALEENPLLAMKALFYARNIRGGLGERDVVLTLFKTIAERHPDYLLKNLHLIPFFGRWKDIFSLEFTPLESQMVQAIDNQLLQDKESLANGGSVSLLAKWLPRTKRSRFARRLSKLMGISHAEYDKMVVALTKRIGVVESQMSANNWDEINYAQVPSNAMLRYRSAFGKHSAERFGAYLEGVKSGTQEIKTGTLYPYDLMRAAGLEIGYASGNYRFRRDQVMLNSWDEAIEAQWNNLPNYLDGSDNVLVIADTSNSMTNYGGVPFMTAIGLAIYFAERNHGVFRNQFMTFSTHPKFITLQGETLKDKVESFEVIVESTDLRKAFQMVLDTAIEHNISQEDLPKALLVISDMQLNDSSAPGYRTFHTVMKKKFSDAGYELPNLVFWNVNSTHNTFHASKEAQGVQLASGHAVSTFRSVLECIGTTPYEAMLKTLNDPMYDVVTV